MIGLDRPVISFGDNPLRQPISIKGAAQEREDRAARQPRVLVVDDERILADTTADILRRAGFEARTAYDAHEALEMTASFHPDCILTDIVMPAMNGVELAIAVTRMHPATKVILYSGQAGIANILDESRAKGYEFPLLAKPVHPAELIEELNELKDPKDR